MKFECCNFFKTNFENNIKPKIYENINNGETKVVLSKEYVNKTLNCDYELMYLFTKIKELLLETDLNISVRKLKKQFVFYKKINGIDRESDFFKVNFEEKLKPIILKILKKESSITFEECYLKNYLSINHISSTESVYIKLRDILVDTNISISTKKNVISGDDKSKKNHFIFYRKEENKPQNYEKVNFDEEIDTDEEDFRNYIRESTKENEIIKEEIHEEVFKGFSKSLSLETSISLDNNEYCECPICKKNIEYYSKKCEYCGEKLKWIEEEKL